MPYKSFSVLFCLTAMLVTQVPVKTVETKMTSHLSRQEAIRIAGDFCRTSGFKLPEAPAAQFPAPLAPGAVPSHWQDCWEVTFGKHLSVEVLDASGMVIGFGDWSYYTDFGAYRRHIAQDAEFVPITQEDAMARAVATLKAMGMKNIGDTDAWAMSTVQRMQPAANDRNLNAWQITWKRLYQGIPCRDEWARATFQAETGEVRTASIGCPVPPLQLLPGKSLLEITMQQAVTLSTLHLAKQQIPSPELRDITTEVLRPNGCFELGGNEAQQAQFVRPVWNCRYTFNLEKDGMMQVDVYIDTQTGQVVGGARAGEIHNSKPAPPPAQTLQRANEVRIFRRSKTGSWPDMPTLVLNSKTQAAALRQLQQVSAFDKDTHLPLGDIKMVAVGADKSYSEFNYDIGSGRLMQYGQSSILPQALITQLQNMGMQPLRAANR